MIAFICLFFPATIAGLVWEKINKVENKEWSDRVLRYTIFNIIINAIMVLFVNLLTEHIGNIVLKIQGFSDFAIKYLVMASLLAVIIPYGTHFAKHSINITISREKPKYVFHWRLFACVYGTILAGLNIIRIFDNNFWGDEAFSIRLAKMSVPEMLASTAGDVHPPLYYLMLIAAYRVFGNYGWVYHFVSVIPMIILIIFSLTVLWRRFGKEASLVFITFVGIANTAVAYNVEVRMYSLAFMFVLFAFYGFYKTINDEKMGLTLFVVASLGAAYTHYYAMMSVAFFYLALLVYTVKKKFELKKLIIGYTVTIFGYLPWLVQMVTTFKRTSEEFWMTEVSGYLESILFYYNSEKQWYAYGMFIFTILLVIYLIIRDMKILSFAKHDKYEVTINCSGKEICLDTKWLLWGVIASVGTLVVGEMISVLIRPAFIVRYLYPVVSVMWITMAVGISKLKNKKIVAIAIIIITLVVYFPEYLTLYTAEKNQNQKCEKTQKMIQSLIDDNDIILTNSTHFNWTILDYYFPENTHEYITNGYDEFEENKNYWLFWMNDLTEDDKIWLEKEGYYANEEVCGGILGLNNVHAFKLAITASQ